jgi:putative transposase
MSEDRREAARVRWAQLRFSIVGTLLSSPPKLGELKALLRELAKKPYTLPTREEVVYFAATTIERWYYRARETDRPIVALERKVPKHAGGHPSVSSALGTAIERLYRQHPTWSYQLHYDNLQTLARQDASLGVLPSYPTVRRYMQSCGLLRQRFRRSRKERDAAAAVEVQARETRSYEHAYVHGLWHLDSTKAHARCWCRAANGARPT